MLTGFIGLLIGGCRAPEVKIFNYREVSLSPSEIKSRIKSIDRLYAPPRTLAKVEKSFWTCRDSISKTSRDRVLWRMARATAWLAENFPDWDGRVDLAKTGVSIGRESVRLPVDKAEPYFYCALNLGVLSSLYKTKDLVGEMIDLCKKAIELDETSYYAGPHRFLGILYYQTEGYPMMTTGTLDDALRHLERACELAPDYGHNHLALARALIEDDQYDAAKTHLQKVIDLPNPDGDEVKRATWVREAQVLIRQL
jgi:tetratricopeptide (TPR) repeat protein